MKNLTVASFVCWLWTCAALSEASYLVPPIPPAPELRSIVDAFEHEQLRFRVFGEDGECIFTSFQTSRFRGFDNNLRVSIVVDVREVDGRRWVVFTSYNLYSLGSCASPSAARRVLLAASAQLNRLANFIYDESDGTVTAQLSVPMPDGGMTGALLRSVLDAIVNAVDEVDPVMRRAMESGMVDWPGDDLGPQKPTGMLESIDAEGKPVEIGWALWFESDIYASTIVTADKFLRDFCALDDEQREELGRALSRDFGGTICRKKFAEWASGAQYIEQHYPPYAIRFWGPVGTTVSATVSCDQIMRGPASGEAVIDAMGFIDVEPQPDWRPEALMKIEHSTEVSVSYELRCGASKSSGRASSRVQPVGVSELGLPAGIPVAAYINEMHPWVKDIVREAKNFGIVDALGATPQTTLGDAVPQIYSIWRALRHRDLRYVGIPSATEGAQSQSIRQFHESIAETGANCADGSAALASVLQSMGFDTHLCLVPGHVFVGVYLGDSETTGDWLFVETTMIGDDTPSRELKFLDTRQTAILTRFIDDDWYSFEGACCAGEKLVSEGASDGDLMIVSIRSLRAAGLNPIPAAKTTVGSIPARPDAAPMIARRTEARAVEAEVKRKFTAWVDSLPETAVHPYHDQSEVMDALERVRGGSWSLGRMLRAVDGESPTARIFRALAVFGDALEAIEPAMTEAYGVTQGSAFGPDPEGISLDLDAVDAAHWGITVKDTDGDEVLWLPIHAVDGGVTIDGNYLDGRGDEFSTVAVGFARALDRRVLTDSKFRRNWIDESIRVVASSKHKTREEAFDAIVASASAATSERTMLDAAPNGQRATPVSKPAEPTKQTTEHSGISVVDTVRGTDPIAKAGDIVRYHYVMKLDDGTVIFESRKGGGKPRAHAAGDAKAPAGIGPGLIGLRAGAHRIATIPPERGYGAKGHAPLKIPPNATLVFEIDVISVTPK